MEDYSGDVLIVAGDKYYKVASEKIFLQIL